VRLTTFYSSQLVIHSQNPAYLVYPFFLSLVNLAHVLNVRRDNLLLSDNGKPMFLNHMRDPSLVGEQEPSLWPKVGLKMSWHGF
jgi:hypothetical protein